MWYWLQIVFKLVFFTSSYITGECLSKVFQVICTNIVFPLINDTGVKFLEGGASKRSKFLMQKMLGMLKIMPYEAIQTYDQ